MPVKLQKADFTTGMSHDVRVGSFEWWVSRSKPFKPHWRPYEARGGQYIYQERCIESTLHRCGSPVKLVRACLDVRNDLHSSFHQCGGHVKHVQAS